MNAIEANGFEVVPRLFDRESMSTLAESIARSDAKRSRAGIRNALHIPSVQSIATNPLLMGFAENVLGEGAFPFRASLFDKSSQANWLVVWHQDTALPLSQRKEIRGWGPWSVKEGIVCAHAPGPALELILAIRVHLNDSNEENGSLRVLPGTHRMGVLSDDSIHDLVAKIDPVDCYVQAGGVLLMRPLLIHSSSKARAKTGPRQVLHIEFARSKSLPGGLELAMCEGVKALTGNIKCTSSEQSLPVHPKHT